MSRTFGKAWIALTVGIALHVADEAIFDFLAYYDRVSAHLEEIFPWLPIPHFTFGSWIVLLSLGILLMAVSAPYAFLRDRWTVMAGRILGVLMVLNGLLHLVGSVYLGSVVPGSLSSPILIATALLVLLTSRRPD